jgi:RteC protein
LSAYEDRSDKILTNILIANAMKDFITELQETMRSKISAISADSKVQEIVQKLSAVGETITAMKTYILNYTFKTASEEIEFFKHYKPQFYSELLYYKRLLELETTLPVGKNERNSFFEAEIRRSNGFLDRKRDWLVYYRTGAKDQDKQYFLRNSTFDDPSSVSQMLTSDTRFCTVGSIIFSRIICSEKLIKELESRIASLHEKEPVVTNPSSRYGLRWTGSKTDAIEFLYWLHSSEAINDGRVDVKRIANWLEESLDIDLGNYYRVFQGIRIRKDRLQFTGSATKKFVKRMDEQDENPRY